VTLKNLLSLKSFAETWAGERAKTIQFKTEVK